MQVRRALLLFAVVLFLSASAAALVSPTEEGGDETAPAPPPTAPKRAEREATERPPPGELVELEFEVGGRQALPRDRRRTESVNAGMHVVVSVSATAPGQVELKGLGRVGPVTPGTPAVFDVLAARAGRFEVVFIPAEGSARRAGTLVVESA